MAIFDSSNIITMAEAASILIQMNRADMLLNPINRLEIYEESNFSSKALTQPVKGKSPPQDLYCIKNAWKLGTQLLHSYRPMPTPKYLSTSAKHGSTPGNFFARNTDIDTTASAKWEAPGQIPKDDHMDVDSTIQTPTQGDSRAGNTVSHTSSNVGAGLIIKNQPEVAKAPKYRWRLCTYCGVPGHPIKSCPMIPCRHCQTVGHPTRTCPNLPCKYCNTIGQHAVKDCPIFHAERNAKLRAATARWRKKRKAASERAAKNEPNQPENSLTMPFADDEEEEEAHINPVNPTGKRGLAKETRVQSPIYSQPSHQHRSSNRPNLPCGYCHDMGHLPKDCPVAQTDKNERERGSSAMEREMKGQAWSDKIKKEAD